MSNWQKFPDTAPLDRNILIRGEWKDPPEGKLVIIGKYSSLMSDGKHKKWYGQFFIALENINVDFTEWTDIPE